MVRFTGTVLHNRAPTSSSPPSTCASSRSRSRSRSKRPPTFHRRRKVRAQLVSLPGPFWTSFPATPPTMSGRLRSGFCTVLNFRFLPDPRCSEDPRRRLFRSIGERIALVRDSTPPLFSPLSGCSCASSRCSRRICAGRGVNVAESQKEIESAVGHCCRRNRKYTTAPFGTSTCLCRSGESSRGETRITSQALQI
jgi:hypothetical protein